MPSPLPGSAATTPDQPRLLALDWGTSNLRATLLGDGGAVLVSRSAACGVMAVQHRRFEEALRDLAGDWINAYPCPLIASGMIGSRQGWIEVPYADCPATHDDVARRLGRVPIGRDRSLHIVPGLRVRQEHGEYDVMRGEETQLWGAGLVPGQSCVLPGTHAKWARMGEGDRIDGFRTYMTGELYALLTQHGILGRLMEFGESSSEDFERGVRLGLAEYRQATHIVFAVRTAGLMERVPARGLPDYLSGLLIGIEIGSAAAVQALPEVVVLGDPVLALRYAVALRLAGVVVQLADPDATVRGQWRVACAAGLIPTSSA